MEWETHLDPIGEYYHYYNLKEIERDVSISHYGVLNVLGNLVSGTEFLEHTLIFTQLQSMSRTLANANYKAYAYSPKVSNQLLRKSLSLSRTSNYIDSRETAIGKQHLIFNEDVELDNASALILINNSNFNTFTNWE